MKVAVAVFLIVLVSILGTLTFTDDKSESPAANLNSSEATEVDPDSNTSKAEITTKGEALDYSDNGYTEFPKDILSKTNAIELDLSGNYLSGSLPGEIRFLTKLQVLNVSDNNMTGIPAEVGQLINLRILNYANNGITGLPNELGNLKNLEILDLSGNNPSQLDLDAIRNKLPPTVNIIL